MSELARWTTPSITYRPSKVSASDIIAIYLVVTQRGNTNTIEKDISDATLENDGFLFKQVSTRRGI